MSRAFGDWLTPAQIEQKIIALVSNARRRYGLPDECSGAEACQRMQLEWHRGPLDAGTDGFWADRIIVVNNTVTWPARVEFTIFHEIMHFLLDEDGELIEFFTDTLRRNNAAYKSAIEKCCNQGAAEFLMPQARVRQLIAELGFSVHLVQELSNRTGASLIAAAAQIAVCAPIDCFLAICAFEPTTASSVRSGIYVEYAFAPHRGKYTLARFTPIPEDHLIAIAAAQSRSLRERSFVPFRSGRRMPCMCEVANVASRYVALLELERHVPVGQRPLPW